MRTYLLQSGLSVVASLAVGLLFWAPIAAALVLYLSRETGIVPFSLGFGSGGLPPWFVLGILVAFGLLHAFFVGLGGGLFQATTIVKGALGGLVGTMLGFAFFYIFTNAHNIVSGKLNFDHAFAEINRYLVAYVLLAIPSALIGGGTARLTATILSRMKLT